MTGPTPDHPALGILAEVAPPRPHPPAAWRRLACAALAVLLIACGDDGGGNGGSGTPDDGGEPPMATEPVDLPPGQTVVELAWEPSAGHIANYLVFVSRNHGAFLFNQVVPSPVVTIPGAAGDEIRITVVARSQSGDMSAASLPSVEVRFHAAAPSDVADEPAPGLSGGGRSAAAVVAVAEPIRPEPLQDETSSPADEELVANDGANDGSEEEAVGGEDAAAGDSPVDVVLTRAVRDRLLRADARLPLSREATLVAAADPAADWLGARVESEVLAGLTLIGTAERAEDALRDLIWRDAAGQVYVSDGEAALESDDTASTLIPAIQLGESERFVALADVDGDGQREWLLEETTTGEAWLRVDPSSLPTSAQSAVRPVVKPPAARLLGSGEFDGQVGAELLWQAADGALSLARAATAGPEILAGARVPFGTELIAITDLDGDGRDDLVGRDVEGQLALGQTVLDEGTGGFWIEWTAGAPGVDADAPLVGTLDLDHDGRAELAWLVGDAVETRAIGDATPRAFEF